MILEIPRLLVLHWGLTEMAIGALLCGAQHVSLHGKVFPVSLFPSPLPLIGLAILFGRKLHCFFP